MRIQVAKSDLEESLQLVKPTMASSGALDDISVHYLFRARDGSDGTQKVEVLTNHGAMFSTAVIPGVNLTLADGEPSMFPVEGKRLNQWLAAVPDAALTLEFNDGEKEVLVDSPLGSQRFTSVDPSKFRLWDDLVKGAQVKAKIKASRLYDAFDFVHKFASSDETKRPDLCVFEAAGGKLSATDYSAIAFVVVPGLEQSSFRVHGKDTSKFLSFLGSAGDLEVEVLEHDRALIIKRGDGALMGERKPRQGIPKDLALTKDSAPDHYLWELPVAEVKRRIKYLTAGADNEDTRLRFQQEDDVLHLSMQTVTGKTTTTDLPFVSSTVEADAPTLPTRGFILDYNILMKILDLHKGANIKLGINLRKTSGYVRYRDTRDDVEIFAVAGWLKDTK